MKLTNKSVKWWEFTVVLVFFISLFGSCRYELVREPTLIYDESKNAADYEDYILPPKEVRASQGQKKSVTLSWEPVENAVQYQIYSAATPYDPFAKISETKAAETEIIIDEESGITKYYSVCAVNYYGTVSAKSVVVMGSTLAVPVITEITADSEGDAVFLEWWMDNCSEQTYQNSVAFNVYASLKSSPNIKVKNLTVAGNVRNLKIDGLTSKTEYLFEVEVFNSLAGVKETSGKCSAETAHRVLPDAPLDFSITKGIDKNEVVLNWKTPDGAWYRQNSGASGFVKHPLYFEIYKKESGKEGEYTRLALIKLGADTSASQTELVFSDEDKANCSKLDAPYDNYYIGASLSYTDTITDENRGKKFSYYVQSITDDVPAGKIITSQSSCTPVEEGWTVGVPVFSIKTDYQQTGTEDQARFTQITFEYNLKFDNYGIGYTYFVKRQQLALTGGTPVGEPQWLAYNSVESINAKKDIFNPVQGQTENEYGYYIYTLYLCQAGTTEAECKNNQFYYEAPASGRYIVTHDASNIPKIGSFTVDDGYTDKYKLKWEYNSEYVYTIHWWKMHGDEKGTEERLEIAINNANITTEGGKKYYNYTHQGITSGDRRIYQLEASTGISSYAKYSNNPPEEDESILETLGTPEPSFTSYDYNTITVTWPKVQKADDLDQYVVSAKYENQNQELVTESNISITTQEGDDNTIKCIITNPDGYNDAEKSGKKIKLTVTAKNGSKGQTSNQPIDVCTLGPALSDLQVVKPVQDEVITIKWNKIQGAAGYKIVRNFYNDVKDPSQHIEDYYYFDGNSVTANGESVAKKRVEVRDNGDGTIQLTDKYCEPESENTYETNQSRIAWGLPYEYIVLPVKENGSPSSVPSYSNINKLQKVGVTKGFGLYVSAEKSESTSKQVVTWTKPNENAEGPVLYYRVAGSDENRWTKLSEEFGNGLGFNPNKKTEAYEYLIAYNRGGSELTKVPLSLLNDSEKGGLETAEINYSYTGEAEKANKGYLLVVDFSIRAGNEYSEVVEWEPWDYSKRAIGPDGGAVLSIKNYNIGTDWTQFATLDENLNCLDQNLGANLTNTVVNKRTITQVSLKPQKMMDTTKANSITKGQLMVLRDARHYYALTFTRNGNTYELGKDDSIYGYREINNYEYIKMVMALFSNPMEYIGELDDKNDSLPDGSVAYIHRGSLSHDFDFTYTDYAPEFNLPSGVSAKSQISINCSGVASRNLAGFAGYTKTISSTTIKTKRLDEKIQMPDCYEGSITFELKYESGTNKAVINGITYQDDSRKVFVPFRMYNHNTNYYQDASYGWWN